MWSLNSHTIENCAKRTLILALDQHFRLTLHAVCLCALEVYMYICVGIELAERVFQIPPWSIALMAKCAV